MNEQIIMRREIVEEHQNRMLQIRKYYPFFKLAESSLSQFKEGKYEELDMGYLTMAILRFFIEENNFKEKDVIFEELEEFLKEVYTRDFQLQLTKEEAHELSLYIFDKIKNDGKPFTFSYFDPVERIKKQLRMRLVEGHMIEDTLYYSITAEGIEFYLDTKELKDESTISVEQLLLEKMIQSKNFKGGAQVVRRINNEVKKLQLRKNEVLSMLSQDVFQGIKECEDFMKHTTKWFDEEQKLFEKNSELIRLALNKARQDEQSGDYNSQYYRAMNEIFVLEEELKLALQKHKELLSSCMDLQKKADELVLKAKLRSLHTSFDFEKMGHVFMEQDRADKLSSFVLPLFRPNIMKTFALPMLDELLTFRPEKPETGEKITQQQEENYVFEDELEEARIENNYHLFLKNLFDLLLEKSSFNLKEYQQYLIEKYGKEILKNGDLYSFYVHLGQSHHYQLDTIEKEKDTFLQGVIAQFLSINETLRTRYVPLSFSITHIPEDRILVDGEIEISNIYFSVEKSA